MSPREARRSLVRPAVVAGTAVLALLDNLAGFLAGVTVVLPHLRDAPIALASYWYPRRGTLIAAGIAAAYAAMALTLAPMEWLSIASRAVTLIAVGRTLRELAREAAVLVRAPRSGTAPADLYQSGFYVQSARLVDCHASRCRKAGFLCKNQEHGGLVLDGCSDTGSAYGLVIEYGGERAMVKGFVSTGATRRALQAVGNQAEIEIDVREFAGRDRPVRLGVTERLEFVDAPGHAEDLKRYRARGYAMAGNRIAIRVDRPMEVVEVHPPSVTRVEMAGVTAEYYPPRPAG